MLGLGGFNAPGHGSVHGHQTEDANPGLQEQKAAAPLPPKLPAQRERTPQGTGQPAMKLSLTRETKDVRGSMKSRVTTITGAAPDMRRAVLHPPRRLCCLCGEQRMQWWGGGDPTYETETVPALAPLPGGALSVVFHRHWDWVTRCPRPGHAAPCRLQLLDFAVDCCQPQQSALNCEGDRSTQGADLQGSTL